MTFLYRAVEVLNANDYSGVVTRRFLRQNSGCDQAMKRKKPAPTRSSPEVEAAIKKIKRLHDIGHRSLKKMPENRGYGSSIAKAEADEHGMNEDTLRKARQFAELYSDDDLDELAGLCRRHECVLGTSFIILLVRVPDRKQRLRLQRKVTSEHWTASRLEQAITSRYGPRRAGGRRPAIPRDAAELLGQVESMCDAWVRWHLALTNQPHDKRKKPASALLPSKLLKQLDGAVEQLREIQGAAGRQLRLKHPSRRPKIVIHDERERRTRDGIGQYPATARSNLKNAF